MNISFDMFGALYTQGQPRVAMALGSVGKTYGVASVSRIDKITGLFCQTALSKRRYSAKETYNFIDPTDRSHPIGVFDMNRFLLTLRGLF